MEYFSCRDMVQSRRSMTKHLRFLVTTEQRRQLTSRGPGSWMDASNVTMCRLRHALLGYFRLCQIRVSQVPEVARTAAKPVHRFSTQRILVAARPMARTSIPRRSKGGRAWTPEKRGEQLWRLHVNCTSSGALVNSIPGTCWSAIHMTVPCCLTST